MKIYAPVKDFNGMRNTVRFVNGVGKTNDPKAVEWFVLHGYSVEKCDEPPEKAHEKCDEQSLSVNQTATDQVREVGTVEQPNFDAMNPNEIREWMKEHGYGLKMKNIRSKEKLLEIIRG